MVLKPDQQRVCMMLKETITLLCKNGLAFKKKFCIDAVIGITLDDEDMFHVSVSEIIKSTSHDDSDTTPSSCEMGEARREQRKRHKADGDDLSDGLEANSECGNDSDPDLSSDNTSMTIKQIDIKGEQPEEEKQDIIFVKQELGLDWSQSQESGANVSDSQNNSNLRSVPDMNMLAGSTGPNYNLWSAANLQSLQQYNQSASATITTADTNILMAAAPGEYVHSSTEQSLMQQSVLPSTSYFCSLCNKPFKYKRSLHAHKKIHQGIYRYICPYCGKGCTSTAMLKGHIANKHAGVKEYKCNICQEEFAYVVNLKTHMLRRHPDSVTFQMNPAEHFQCKQCNKTFKYKGTYLCHVAVHRGIYKYICPFCGKGCTSNAVLKGHISKHTGIKEFKCPICDYEFAYAVDLKRHLKRKHEKQLAPGPISYGDIKPEFGCQSDIPAELEGQGEFRLDLGQRDIKSELGGQSDNQSELGGQSDIQPELGGQSDIQPELVGHSDTHPQLGGQSENQSELRGQSDIQPELSNLN